MKPRARERPRLGAPPWLCNRAARRASLVAHDQRAISDVLLSAHGTLELSVRQSSVSALPADLHPSAGCRGRRIVRSVSPGSALIAYRCVRPEHVQRSLRLTLTIYRSKWAFCPHEGSTAEHEWAPTGGVTLAELLRKRLATVPR